MNTPSNSRRVWLIPAVLACVVASLWAFPRAWYSKSGGETQHWFAGRDEIAGWHFESVPIDEAAEKALVADKTVNGEFTDGSGVQVRIFAANRFEEKSNEIGLFIHTPDRCWVEAGWKLEPAAPDTLQVNLHGLELPLERRIFLMRGSRELVYFSGLIGGAPAPYRLDHNLSAGMRVAMNENSGAERRRAAGAADVKFWQRLLSSFASRRQLFGPKQFIRISTPIRTGEDVLEADERLQAFLAQWLVSADYQTEKNRWKAAAAAREK